jgi:repressor LexA
MAKRATRQHDVMTAIREYMADHGVSPSIRDLMHLTGITSSSIVSYYLDLLEDEKLISRVPEIARSIRILEESIEQPSRPYLIYRAIKVPRDFLTGYKMRRRLVVRVGLVA